MSDRNAPDAQFELRHLRHLVAVHERGTLQAAAEALHLSQSALTKSIQRLEETLGAPLLARAGRHLGFDGRLPSIADFVARADLSLQPGGCSSGLVRDGLSLQPGGGQPR